MFFNFNYPLRHIGGLKLRHFLQKHIWVVTDDEVVGVFLAHEAFLGDVLDKLYETVIIAVYVEQRNGLVEDAQLAEYEGFEELVHRADAAWQGDETVGHVLKDFLAFGHRLDHNQFADFWVTHAHVQKVLGDGAGHLAVAFHHHVGDNFHQAHTAAAVEQFATVVGQNLAQFSGFFLINRVEAHAAAAKNADFLHLVNFCKGSIFYFCSLKNLETMNRNIGILGAMAQEIDEVKALLTEKTVVKIANREFVVGKIGNVRCVVVFSKWGKVAATITATLLIQEFAVTDLIFIGTAGALANGLKVGDIVISKRLVQHDLDARPMMSRFEIPLLNRLYVESDSDLTALAGRAVTNLINIGVKNMVGEEAVKEFNLNPTLYFGDVASGDQFINSIEKRDEILSLLPDVLCVEMEGAAVAQVCLEFNTPFTVIRTISDTADHNARVDFGRFIAEVANAYSRAIVQEIMRLV